MEVEIEKEPNTEIDYYAATVDDNGRNYELEVMVTRDHGTDHVAIQVNPTERYTPDEVIQAVRDKADQIFT